MRVIVLGAGVVGVTTAYYLSRLGCDVTVVDRAEHAGNGASFANAGQLSYSFTDALAKPEFIARIPGLLLGNDKGVQVRLSSQLMRWGMRFLGQCTSRHARQNTLAVLKVAMRSAELMEEMRKELPFDFWHREAGKLVLLSSAKEIESATAVSELKQQHGCDTRVLRREEAAEIESALRCMSGEFLGAVYSESDEVADARKFTTGLKEWLETHQSVKFRLSSPVQRLVSHKDRICAVETANETLEADAFVVCMGAWSHELLRSAGVNPHVFPVRGYSITLPPGECAPSVSITALKHRVVYSRLNGFVRIAGFADFTGFDTSADESRVRSLIDVAQSLAPQAADYGVDEQAINRGRPYSRLAARRHWPKTAPRLHILN
ncbi:MAG: FAD-dependent oxidoreductase, partial [Pseudomonadota bacterium]